MKKFNLNDYMYIKITEAGWQHLLKTVGQTYINACIKTSNTEKVINGETWYKLQCWEVFEQFPINLCNYRQLIEFNVMFDEDAIKNL